MDPELFIRPQSLLEPGTLPECLHRVVRLGLDRPGLLLGDVLQLLTDSEIRDTLAELALAETDSTRLMQFCFFCVYLANSEGLPVLAKDRLNPFVSRLSILLQVEQWARLGYVSYGYRALSIEHFDISSVQLTAKGKQAGLQLTVVSGTLRNQKR